jgi:hypothetical protein
MSDCYLAPSGQFFQLYHNQKKYISIRWWWFLLCTRPIWILFASSLKKQSTGRHVSPWLSIRTHWPDFELDNLCSDSLMLLSGEAANTNFIVFALTELSLELNKSTITSQMSFSWNSDFIPIMHHFNYHDMNRVMVLNGTFNNISVISWPSVLLMEENRSTWRKPLTCRKSLTNLIT